MSGQVFDGFTLRKKTKGYRQKIRHKRMTICGTSTGVLLLTTYPTRFSQTRDDR